MNTPMTQENQMLAHMSASEHQTNHVLHLILTLITFGLWSFVWLFVASSNIKKRNKIKSKAGMPTQFNFPRLLLWINFTELALLILMLVAAGDAKADLSIENFKALSSGNQLDKASVEMYVGGVAKGYLNANGYLKASGQAQLFCFSGDIDTPQALKLASQAIDEHLLKSPGDVNNEIVELLLLMQLKAIYPC